MGLWSRNRTARGASVHSETIERRPIDLRCRSRTRCGSYTYAGEGDATTSSQGLADVCVDESGAVVRRAWTACSRVSHIGSHSNRDAMLLCWEDHIVQTVPARTRERSVNSIQNQIACELRILAPSTGEAHSLRRACRY